MRVMTNLLFDFSLLSDWLATGVRWYKYGLKCRSGVRFDFHCRRLAALKQIQHQHQTCLLTWTSLLKTTSSTPGKKDSERRKWQHWFFYIFRFLFNHFVHIITVILFCRCKLYSLERKCFSKMEKLKSTFEDHLHHGIPASDILDKTVSFFSLKRALLLHSGYSRCSREILRLSLSPEQDVTPLFWCERPSQTELNKWSTWSYCVCKHIYLRGIQHFACSLWIFSPRMTFRCHCRSCCGSSQRVLNCVLLVMHKSLRKPSCITFAFYVFSGKCLLYSFLSRRNVLCF